MHKFNFECPVQSCGYIILRMLVWANSLDSYLVGINDVHSQLCLPELMMIAHTSVCSQIMLCFHFHCMLTNCLHFHSLSTSKQYQWELHIGSCKRFSLSHISHLPSLTHPSSPPHPPSLTHPSSPPHPPSLTHPSSPPHPPSLTHPPSHVHEQGRQTFWSILVLVVCTCKGN